MHWLDRVTAALPAGKGPEALIFHQGWGNPERVAYYLAEMRTDPGMAGLAVEWGKPIDVGGFFAASGARTSPSERRARSLTKHLFTRARAPQVRRCKT